MVLCLPRLRPGHLPHHPKPVMGQGLLMAVGDPRAPPTCKGQLPLRFDHWSGLPHPTPALPLDA